MKSILELKLVNERGVVFAGSEVASLLAAVDEHGSINHAAKVVGVSYVTACGLLHLLEKNLPFNLLTRKSGGKGGGGAFLTPEGRVFLKSFGRYQLRMQYAAELELAKFSRDLNRDRSSG
jgi:molybdate transport system regulatory protein